MPEQEQKMVGIRLESINVLKTILDFAADTTEPDTEFAYAVNVDCNANLEEKTVLCVVTIGIKRINGEKTVGLISVGFIYIVTPFEEVIQADENKQIRIPKNIVDFVNPLSISTTRGIMFSTFKGTFLHNALLPILDPSRFSEVEKVGNSIQAITE